MDKILSKYKERLINLSGRNRSLVSKKLPQLRAFDLYKLEEFSSGITEIILDFIINRKPKKLYILPDYTAYYTDKLKELEKEVYDKRSEELEKESDDLVKQEEIKGKYDDKLQKEKEKLNKQKERIMDYSVSIGKLSKEITSIVKETGRNELYIGYPFVEGKLKDGRFIKAPLFMFPISLLKHGDQYAIENKEESSIYLNKVLLLAIGKYNEIKVSSIETEFSKLEETFVEDTLKLLKKNNIIIQNGNEKIEKFKEYTNVNLPSFELGELNLSLNMILGQFPIANSIYSDYENLLEVDVDNSLLNNLLKTNSAREESFLDQKEEHGKLSFKDEELSLITSLDYSQEKAVKLTNEVKNLVIYGPPGTGKSQTIANIISNALAKGKTVLMVSQKRAALDVIYNRLGELNSKAILIYDNGNDKKSFYSKVASSLEYEIDSVEAFENKILNNSRKIDFNIEMLEKLAETLHKERKFGLTLQEMYSKTKAIKSREDSRYSSYLEFKKKNNFKEYTYEQLQEAINGFNEKEILSYKTYKDLLNRNPFIDDVNLTMNFIDIDEFSQKIESLIEPIKLITNKANEDSDVYFGLVNLLKENDFILKDELIKGLVEGISKEKYGYLLEPLNTGKWWSIKYWLEYSSNKKKEKENKLEYNAKFTTIQEKVYDLYNSICEGLGNIDIVKKALNNRVYNIVIEELLKGEDLTDYFKDIIEALHFIEEYKTELKISRGLNEVQVKILEYALGKNVSDTKNLIKELMEFIVLYNIAEIEKEEEVERCISNINSFDSLVQDVNVKMQDKTDYIKKLILNKWNRNINLIEGEKDYREFKRQANKKSRLLPIRKYIEDYREMILKVFPCFLLSPETVSEILPLEEEMFDIVIFDEASQMYVENAIPTIYRGKQVIIAGDDKQLRPNASFSSRYVEEEEENERDVDAALEEESLLDLAKVNYNDVHLNYHYRSSYEELINFSNYAFYGGRLKISPNTKLTNENENPIERVLVDGYWIDKCNVKEGETVADIIEKVLKERKNNETIGVITFNISQKTAIEDILEKRARDNSEFNRLYTEEVNRYEDGEDVSLFIKNIENVQGDERDIIIFSISYGKNQHEKVAVNFGTLSQDGGENRLNVAISRAKKKIYVVTSIEPEELNVDNTKNLGPKLFKKYLQYARAVSKGDKEEAKIILESVLDTQFKDKEDIKHDSNFEAEVYDELTKKGYEVHTQVGVSGYKIDLAIYDNKKSKYILGIECDGATYHSSKSARERDIHRQRYLESRGWKIARIWSYNWWSSPKKEIERICEVINSIK